MRNRKWIFIVGLFFFAGWEAEGSAPSQNIRRSTPIESIEVSTATGDSIEYDNVSGFGLVKGSATVVTSTGTLHADKITFNTLTHEGHLEGNVDLEQTSSTITGTEAFYNWQLSTGVIFDALGTNPPYYFRAHKMIKLGPDVYLLDHGEFSSCDGDPPHYRFRATRGIVKVGKRITLRNARFILDDKSVFWSPVYSRSLEPKKYQLRIEPGSSGRDGLILKSALGYPFTPNTFTRFRWDYFQYTGNGFGVNHQYFTPNIRGNFDGYYVEDHNPDIAPESKRYDITWTHYQKFSSRLTGNMNFNLKSDQIIGNQFMGVGADGRVENNIRGILSEGGLTYQFPRASLSLQASRQDRFDSTLSSSSFIGKVVLPQLTLQTIPLAFKHFPFLTTFNADFINRTQDRLDPTQPLIEQKAADTGVQFKKDFHIRKLWSITPSFGYQEHWQDRDITDLNSTHELFQGRDQFGVDIRRRFYRKVDMTLSQSLVLRSAPNQWKLDKNSDDRGIETNQLTTSAVTRIGRDSLMTVASGADFRQAPVSLPSKYDHLAERITSPSLDYQYQLNPMVTLYYREVYSLFDPVTRETRRTPLNTSGEIEYGQIGKSIYLTQGFNFTKPQEGTKSIAYLDNKIRFYLTPKWFVDAYVNYQIIGTGELNYTRTHPVEKTLRLVRDLHCWVLRMEFSSLPDRNEASFYIDLKTNLTPQGNVFRQNSSNTLVSDPVDMGKIFPQSETDQHK